MYDLIIKNGLYFDGSGQPGQLSHVGIRNGRIAAVSPVPLDEWNCPRVVDARNRWVTPGFIEIHSHYDAEVMVAPALKESVRHGVTTVMVGSCSLSMIAADPLDCSDLFTRVEAVPRAVVLPLLQKMKSWRSPSEYRQFFEQHPLGPNLCSFIGHSDMRAAVMGLERASTFEKPTEQEMKKMEALLHESLDAGMVGLSVMTTRLDKMDGDRVWSRPLPSTFANWQEYGRLFRILRSRSAVLQGAPNAVTKINIVAFFWHAIGWFRKPLKMTMLTAMDLKSQPALHRATRISGWIVRNILAGDWRWQALSTPFRIYFEGLELAVLEEFATGERIRDIAKDPDQAYALVADPNFRNAFRKELASTFTKGLWHRDFSDVTIVNCPDATLVGKSLAEVAKLRGCDAVDAWFDLCIQYRNALRCTTQIANHRPAIMHKLLSSPSTQIGFADSGAHIRGLAGYNFPLRLLKYVRDAELAGHPFMHIGAAVRRASGDLADWFGLEAGYIRVGDRADLVVINPQGLNGDLDRAQWAPMENLGLERCVNRNDAAVDLTVINGQIAYSAAEGFVPELGRRRGFGRFLPGKLVTPRSTSWSANLLQPNLNGLKTTTPVGG